MSYDLILNLRIRKFKSYFPLGKRLVFDGKSEIIDGKWVSAPQKRIDSDMLCVGVFYVLIFTFS